MAKKLIKVPFSGTTTSDAVHLGQDTIVGIAIPASWAGTSLTFTVSIDGGVSFLTLGNTTLTVAASTVYAVDPTDFACVTHVKLVSGSSENGRVATLIVQPIN